MKISKRKVFDVAFFFVMFLAIQVVVGIVVTLVCRPLGLKDNAILNIVSSLVSSLVTIALFAWRRWTPFNRAFSRSRQWGVMWWTMLLAMGSMAPSEFIVEASGLQVPQLYTQMMAQMMNHDLGFIAICVVVPVAEEVVFRGAVLRKLLQIFGYGQHWWAIVVSAALFGAAHLNMAQFVHAFLIGLLLGWLYFRTHSVVPGVAFHLINNAVTFITIRLMPGTAGMTLIEFFGGNYGRLAIFIVCSLCVFVPSLLQLNMRLKRVDNDHDVVKEK